MIDTLFPEQADQVAPDQPDGSAEVGEQPEGDAKPADETKPADGVDEITKLRSELEKERKRREDKDRHIGKQGDELGKLRKKLERLAESLGIEGDPEEALKERQERQAEETEKSVETYRAQAREWVGNKIPEFDNLMPAMREILKNDAKYGVDEKTLQAFESDPYRFPIDTLVGLAERAALRVENEKLRKQLEALPKKLSQAAGTNIPKASPSVAKDTDEVDIYGQLGIYRLNKS
jgi:DNA repair exonuclease SbcCD ATPase subunit